MYMYVYLNHIKKHTYFENRTKLNLSFNKKLAPKYVIQMELFYEKLSILN